MLGEQLYRNGVAEVRITDVPSAYDVQSAVTVAVDRRVVVLFIVVVH